MISVVIDCNIIFFSNVIVWIILSMHAFIGYSFLSWNIYANELCILPKRPNCNFKQTIVHINMQEGEKKKKKNTIHPFNHR